MFDSCLDVGGAIVECDFTEVRNRVFVVGSDIEVVRLVVVCGIRNVGKQLMVYLVSEAAVCILVGDEELLGEGDQLGERDCGGMLLIVILSKLFLAPVMSQLYVLVDVR